MGSGEAPRRAVVAWVLYDWAYGAFTTVVSTFVFATYFTRAVAPDQVTGASQWAGAQALAGLIVAVLAMPLGAVADSGGRRRAMLALATMVMIAATLGLWFVRPAPAYAFLALALSVVATVAFEVATVFYNAMLPGLARPRHLGRLSMLGWGAGYAGGLCCLFLCLALLVRPSPPLFGLDAAAAEPVRATALLAGLWLAAFSWPCAVFVPEQGTRIAWQRALRQGVAEMGTVLRAVVRDRPLAALLAARLLTTDGLTTLFAFGGIYAAGEFGLDAQGVLVFGIALNITAGLGALGFALVEDRIGSRTTMLVAVLALAALGAALLVIHDVALFWVLGCALGVFVGPAQAAGRSLMAHMAPAESRGAYFGLFALSGRVTGFVGPAALSAATALFHSQRAGMAVIVLLLLLGALALAFVRQPQAPMSARRERTTT